MQWVGYAELASAVSNAGALGIVRPLPPSLSPLLLAHSHHNPRSKTFADRSSHTTAHSPNATLALRPPERDPALQDHDQEPLRREPDPPPRPRPARLPRLRASHHRRRDQDRRNGRQLPRPSHQAIESCRLHRFTQMHHDPARPERYKPRCGFLVDRRIRVRWACGGERHHKLYTVVQGEAELESPLHSQRRFRGRPRSRCGSGSRCRGDQHGHEVHVHDRSAHPPQCQSRHRRGTRDGYGARAQEMEEHESVVWQQSRQGSSQS